MTFTVEIVLPIRISSEANRAGSEHWRTTASRAKDQRGFVRLALGARLAEMRKVIAGGWRGPLRVTMTRLAPRALDSDNVVIAHKHVRDGIADVLGVNDRVPWIEWIGTQEKSATYAERIRIEAIT